MRKTTRQKFADRNNKEEVVETKKDWLEQEIGSSNKSHPLGFNPSDDELDEAEMYGDYEELEIDEEDAGVLDKFLPSAPKERRTLADIIMDKINEKECSG
ncbi:unnamed protein product [Absidia cylindrospora]